MWRMTARVGMGAALWVLFGVFGRGVQAQGFAAGGMTVGSSLETRPRIMPSVRPRVPSSALSQRSALGRGALLLHAIDWRERVRGIERLGSANEHLAWRTLVDSMRAGERVYDDPRSRVAAVRVLARSVGNKPVRRVLSTVLQQARDGEGESLGERLARGTAAMALARHGAYKPLVTALLAGGPGAAPAREALRAYPPSRFEDFIGKSPRMSLAHIELLGNLGDIRAIPALRKQQQRKREAVKWAAAVALASLGDTGVMSSARRWLRDKRPEARFVAVEILARLDAPGFASGVEPLLLDPKTRERVLPLVESASKPELIDAMAKVARTGRVLSHRRRAVQWLGRFGRHESIRALATLLDDPSLRKDALFSMARSPGSAAHAHLSKRLRAAKAGSDTERDLLRACVLRAQRRGQIVAGLKKRLTRALAGEHPDDRAVGSYGLAALDSEQRARLLLHQDPVLVIAAARASGERLPEGAVERFVRSTTKPRARPTAVQLALSGVLLDERAEVSTRQLARWIEGGGAIAPLAAFRFAARDARPFRKRLREWLSGSDPLVRSHLAHGLGMSPNPDAVSLLRQTYRFEPLASVRAAVLRGLALRREMGARATLELARELDPASEVRALARAALNGRPVDWRSAPVGRAFVWARIDGSSGMTAAQLTRSDGLLRVVLSDPEGDIVVGGLEEGRTKALWLAAGAYSRKLPPDGSEE